MKIRIQPFFSPPGLRRLRALDGAHTLYAFDFDGTLAGLKADPLAAAMAPATARLLSDLARVAPVAIISGRGLGDLQARLPGLAATLIGNHGMEGIRGAGRTLPASRRACAAWMQTIAEFDFEAGVEIEDKEVSVSIHYRQALNPPRARARIQAAVATLDPAPRIIGGKFVFNLVPQGAPHKGTALLQLMAQARARTAVFVGDDLTDEDVFALPDGRPDREILKIRVGRGRGSAAEYFIPRQTDINRLLRQLIHHVGLPARAKTAR